jgi:hypothetical protein
MSIAFTGNSYVKNYIKANSGDIGEVFHGNDKVGMT